MSDRLIDLCNRLRLWRCDSCGVRMRGYKRPAPYAAPLCDDCLQRLSRRWSL